jgi:hypothetical protein
MRQRFLTSTIAAVLFALCVAVSAQAQEAPVDPLVLPSAEAIADRHGPMGDGVPVPPEASLGPAVGLADIPALLPGARMVGLYGTSFHTFGYNPTDNAIVLYVAGKGAHVSGAGARLHATIPAPPGSLIVQADYFGFRDTEGNQEWWLMRFDPMSFGPASFSSDTLTGTGPLIGSRAVSELVLPGYEYAVMAQSSSGDPYVRGAVVQYLPPAGDFFAVTPMRVYDSRISGGRIAAGQERVVSVKRALESGKIAVPAGARAVALNLTIIKTVGKGWLSVRPAGTGWSGTPTIKWSRTPVNLSKCTISGVSSDRELAVRCGGTGSTHFAIDVVGYYL